MKRALLIGLVLLSGFVSVFDARADAQFLEHLEASENPVLNPPPVVVKDLKNGIRLFLLQDRTLPMVKVKAIIRTGSIYEPGKQLGLASLTGRMMRSGGAGEFTAEAFDEQLDGMGASLGSSIGREMGTAMLQVLQSDLEEGLKLFFDMLFHPRFEPKRLKAIRLKLEETIRREKDDPSELASYSFRQLVYGKESPWARRPDAKTLRRVRIKDIRDFHHQFYSTKNIIIAASGDFDPGAFVRMVEKMTEQAPQHELRFPPVSPVDLTFDAEEQHIERPLTQSFIRLGHLSIKRTNPDKFALSLLNEILGAGSFKSRLTEDIRTKRGMAYSIWSSIHPATDYGLFTVGVTTRANQTQQVIDLVRGHIRDLTRKGAVTREELSFAKRSILTSLVFLFDVPFKVVDQQAMFSFYGYPEDYWRVYQQAIATTTREDLLRVAKRYLHPDGLKVLSVGPGIVEKEHAEKGKMP